MAAASTDVVTQNTVVKQVLSVMALSRLGLCGGLLGVFHVHIRQAVFALHLKGQTPLRGCPSVLWAAIPSPVLGSDNKY